MSSVQMKLHANHQSRATIGGMKGQRKIAANRIHAEEHTCFILVGSCSLAPAGESTLLEGQGSTLASH